MARNELNKPSSYWDKRRLKNFKANEKYTKEYIKRIKKIYSRSNKEVQDMIDDVYRNYSNDTGIDVQKLKEILSKSESEKTFKELKKKGLDKYIKNNYKSRINRLEQVQAQIYAKAKEIYPKEELEQTMVYKGVINNEYYKTIYDVEQNTGMQYAFSKIDDRMMDAVLSERWSGKNYSERIWTNTDILADNLSETIGSALMSGQGVEKTAREIRERFNVAKYYSERLVRTEMAYFDNQADMMAYEELGVKEYVLVATLDNKTSEYCIEMDGQHFPYSKIVVGENYPPFHPNCRCTTRGYLGKEAEEMMERVAIDNGERKIVPNMSYKEWYSKYIGNRKPTSINNKIVGLKKGNNSKKDNKIENVDNQIRELKKELTDKGLMFEDDFPKICNKEFIKEQLDAIKEVVDNDKVMADYINKYPLAVKEDMLGFKGEAYYSHSPYGFDEHSLNFVAFKLKGDKKEILNNISHYRESGQWISKKMSSIPDEKYIVYHELGHLKEKIMVENYYKENPQFVEKYLTRANNAKTQKEFDTYYANMYKDAQFEIRDKYLIPIQKKNGTINASGGRWDSPAYGKNGLKEIGTYGEKTIEAYELISEGNVILSSPTEFGKNSYIYKDITELLERWYK